MTIVLTSNGHRLDDVVVHQIVHPLADIWIGLYVSGLFDYAYGGTRMVPPNTDDETSIATLRNLAVNESLLKNLLINRAIEHGAVVDLADRLPDGFMQSRVGGARCIIRPRSARVHDILRQPGSSEFVDTLMPVFAEIGDYLNNAGGAVKLTPDFGHFASLSDVLREFTPHVLGIACEVGGCGGKTSYATTGVVAAFETVTTTPDTPITLIGAAGAMGSQFLEYLVDKGCRDVAGPTSGTTSGTVTTGRDLHIDLSRPQNAAVFDDPVDQAVQTR